MSLKFSSFLASFLLQVKKESGENQPEYLVADTLLTVSLENMTETERVEIAKRCKSGDFGDIDVPDTLREELKVIAQALQAEGKRATARKRRKWGEG